MLHNDSVKPVRSDVFGLITKLSDQFPAFLNAETRADHRAFEMPVNLSLPSNIQFHIAHRGIQCAGTDRPESGANHGIRDFPLFKTEISSHAHLRDDMGQHRIGLGFLICHSLGKTDKNTARTERVADLFLSWNPYHVWQN